MPRAPLIKTSLYPYHVTNRSNNKEYFYLDLNKLWSIFCKNLLILQEDYKCNIHCFVLMGNHYHLIITTPLENIGEAMKYFQREIARNSNSVTKRINHFFGGRYKWCLIQSELYYWNAVKYVFRNPVKAHICPSVTQYPYSSLNQVYRKLNWKMDNPFNGSTDVKLDLNWLDTPFSESQHDSLSAALKRRIFKVPQSKGGYVASFDNMQSEKGTVT